MPERITDARLARHLLSRGVVGLRDLVACVEEQRRSPSLAPLRDLLLQRRAISPTDLAAAEATLASGPRVVGPRRLAGHVVLRSLALGPRSEVFLAEDPGGRQVALKVPTEGSERTRFLREARVACSLRHPHLVRGLDHGVGPDGPWLSMEYVAGPTLESRVSRGPRAEQTVIRVGVGVARALGHLHRTGFVHRDVKPANIFIAPEGHALLGDLGLVTAIGAASPDQPSGPRAFLHAAATASGDTLGTPRYMAPEQARRAAEATPAADLYSLGVTLFHAVTGQPPFPDASGFVVLSRHLFDQVPDVRTVRADISPALARVIFRLTRKDPTLRYGSSEAVVSVLETLVPSSARRAA